MTIKHILLPLSGEAGRADTAICGLTLAKTLGAHVTAGYEDDLGAFYVAPGYAGFAPNYGDFYAQMQKMRVARRNEARRSFDQAVQKTLLPIVSAPICERSSTMWIDDEGGKDTPTSTFGTLTDLVILDAPGDPASLSAWNVVETVLFNARRPTLVVPPGTKSVNLSTVIVAWNGSAEAASAVEHALDLLPADARVIVLQIGELKAGRTPSERVVDYLGWHCRTAELRRAPYKNRRAGQIILEEAERVGAGLVVMGAYTHSRTRELLLGGVTDFMLRRTTVPVLMVH